MRQGVAMLLFRTRVQVARVAIFAILLAALAPSLARALAPPAQAAMPWEEICTVGGPQAPRDAAPESGSGHRELTAQKHCIFCVGHAGAAALPSTLLVWHPLLAAEIARFTFVALVSSPRFIRGATQPRAPPALS